MTNVPERTLLLRQRFDSVDQLKAHLHAVEGRGILFFRDPALQPASAGTLLEVTFANSEQTRVVRASTLSRAEGQGMWLSIPDMRFVREVHDRGLVPRKGRRLGADMALRIRRVDGLEHLVSLVDVSVCGARIAGGLPRSVVPRADIELTLAAPGLGQQARLGLASVAWVDGGEAGLVFDRSQPDSRVAIARLFQSLADSWARARTVDHLAGCCRGGLLQEPPMPRLRSDGKDDASRAKVG